MCSEQSLICVNDQSHVFVLAKGLSDTGQAVL